MESQPAILIGNNLEDQGRQRLIVIGVAQKFAAVLGMLAFDRRNIQRRGQKRHHHVEQGLHAFVLQGGSTHHRMQDAGDRSPAQRRNDLFIADVFFFEELHRQVLVVFDDRFDHFLTTGLRHFPMTFRDGMIIDIRTFVVAISDQLHLEQINDAFEGLATAVGHLNNHRIGLEPIDHHVDAAVEIRARAIHLVDEAEPRDLIFGCLPPDRFRLRLNARHAVKHGDSAVKHAQAALHLGGEINMPGRIDDVDLMIVPTGGHRG